MSAPYHNKALPEGTILREWRLEEVLGVGGFGIVYRGKDVHFGETVAIKEYFPGAISDRVDGITVTPTDSSSEEVYQLGRQKFMEEAKVLWNLSRPERHPNLVAVRSLFEIHGTAYMVMDFESGVSLSQMLRDGTMFDEKSLMAIFRPVAEGLERAHQAGVLHRDIKPANILVNKEGRPVLIDFGSARFESNQATNTKVTFYTPPYAAIEQYVKSYSQGPWTDIYALAVTLYQCVTGEKPPEVLERMHGEDGTLLSSRQWPGFSRAFIRAVDAGMAIRPIERPASISAWLKMFDAKDPVVVDEPTRIATSLPQPAAAVALEPTPEPAPELAPPSPPTPDIVKPEPVMRDVAPEPVPAPTPAPQPAPKPVALPEPVTIPSSAAAQASAAAPYSLPAAPPPKRGSKLTLIALGGAAIFAILAGAGLFVSRWHKAPDTTAPAANASAAQIAAIQPANTNVALPAKMDAVIDAAKKAGRKDSEIAALTDAKAKLVAAKADTAQISAIAADTAKTETGLLLRAEKRMWRDVETPPDATAAPGSADVAAKLQHAKTDLDAKLAAPSSQDAGQIIDNLRLSLVSFAAFQDAYGTATPVYVSAKRKAFDTLHTETQSLCDQVATLAKVEEPWFLASSARKAAYKLRQDNAAQAKTLAARLDTLATTVAASNDLRQLSAAVDETTTAKKTAAGLVAASDAAKL